MNTETQQGAFNFAVASRSLKIQGVGDFFRRQVKPQILLTGHWLERAGFKPGHRVEVRIEQPGCLALRFVEQPKEATP